jgi:hypothetical protein
VYSRVCGLVVRLKPGSMLVRSEVRVDLTLSPSYIIAIEADKQTILRGP